MSEIACPRCGVTSPAESAFCRNCGTPFPAAAPTPAAAPAPPPPGWQPPAGNAPAPPPGAYPAPPPGGFPPPQPGFPPPPQAYAPPPGGYPGYPGTAKVLGTNTKWAFGLAGACFVLGMGVLSVAMDFLAPVAAGAGAFMAKKDMDDFTSGRNPQLNGGVAKGAFYLNLVLLGIDVLAFIYGISKAR
jgi:hypothetical protein